MDVSSQICSATFSCLFHVPGLACDCYHTWLVGDTRNRYRYLLCTSKYREADGEGCDLQQKTWVRDSEIFACTLSRFNVEWERTKGGRGEIKPVNTNGIFNSYYATM
jgi:hypothetical protein